MKTLQKKEEKLTFDSDEFLRKDFEVFHRFWTFFAHLTVFNPDLGPVRIQSESRNRNTAF
jgi:hypothetical protein